jgi:hypothetical protein
MCHLQSFGHTLADSVQVLAFPVIGLERLFSVIHPFDKDKQLQRVNWLNGKYPDNSAANYIYAAYHFPVIFKAFPGLRAF